MSLFRVPSQCSSTEFPIVFSSSCSTSSINLLKLLKCCLEWLPLIESDNINMTNNTFGFPRLYIHLGLNFIDIHKVCPKTALSGVIHLLPYNCSWNYLETVFLMFHCIFFTIFITRALRNKSWENLKISPDFFDSFFTLSHTVLFCKKKNPMVDRRIKKERQKQKGGWHWKRKTGCKAALRLCLPFHIPISYTYASAASLGPSHSWPSHFWQC